jgi:hypothetical protein
MSSTVAGDCAVVRASAFTIGLSADNVFVNMQTQEPFFATDYSRMKHGDGSATRKIATLAANMLLRDLSDVVLALSPPRFVLPFKAVPNASASLSRHVTDIINRERASQGLINEADMVHIKASELLVARDYASLGAEDRHHFLNSVEYTIAPEEIKGRNIVFLDDVRITGAAERTMERLLVPMRPRVLVLAYVATLDHELAMKDPTVESRLNTSEIQGMSDIVELVKEGQFELRLRALKMILKSPTNEVRACAYGFPLQLLRDIINGAEAIGQAFLQTHQDQIAVVNCVLQERQMDGHTLAGLGESESSPTTKNVNVKQSNAAQDAGTTRLKNTVELRKTRTEDRVKRLRNIEEDEESVPSLSYPNGPSVSAVHA